MRFAHACVVAGAVLLCSSTAAAGDSLAAREQLKIGYLLAKQGRCDEALPHLAESLRLDVRAITLINLAQCEESVGRLADAMGHWVDARARAQIARIILRTTRSGRARSQRQRSASPCVFAIPLTKPSEVKPSASGKSLASVTSIT